MMMMKRTVVRLHSFAFFDPRCRKVLRSDAKLLHWNGAQKPWNNKDIRLADMWRRYEHQDPMTNRHTSHLKPCLLLSAAAWWWWCKNFVPQSGAHILRKMAGIFIAHLAIDICTGLNNRHNHSQHASPGYLLGPHCAAAVSATQTWARDHACHYK